MTIDRRMRSRNSTSSSMVISADPNAAQSMWVCLRIARLRAMVPAAAFLKLNRLDLSLTSNSGISGSLAYRLAYVADLEATFTPSFKIMLDDEHILLRPGDDRVASLLLWHFVEAVEHRSSALVIYEEVVHVPTHAV